MKQPQKSRAGEHADDGVAVPAQYLELMKSSFVNLAISSSSNDSCSITWHQWQAE